MARDILDEIIENKRTELIRQKQAVSPAELRTRIMEREPCPKGCRSLRAALSQSKSGIIAEFKRKSPSKGWIHPEAKVADVLPTYERSGAAACSILTDSDFFGGSLGDLREARSQVKLPLLRKDFIIDPYQIDQALLAGADAILDIVSWHDAAEIAELAKTFTYARNFLYLGRGYNYPVALEGALKLKEISYIHAEGYPAAEMKHGPIALIDDEMPAVVIAPKRGNYDKVLSNIQEIKARKGRIISIVTEGDTDVRNLSDFSLEIPDTEECFVPLLSVIPLQLLAYHIAIAKGRDVDQPRNLAKSVTVE